MSMLRPKNDHTKFAIEKTIQPFFGGGNVAFSENGLFLATSLGEDAILTYIPLEKRLIRIEGVCHATRLGLLGFLTY